MSRLVALVLASSVLVAAVAVAFHASHVGSRAIPSPAVPARNDPDDVDPARVSESIGSEPSEMDELLAKMNWCGTGVVGEGAPIPDDWGDTIRVRVVDVPWKQLHERLAEARLPSTRRTLVRAFLVERSASAPAEDVAGLMEELAAEEPYVRLRERLERAVAALRARTSWEKAFDEDPAGGKSEPAPSPRDR